MLRTYVQTDRRSGPDTISAFYKRRRYKYDKGLDYSNQPTSCWQLKAGNNDRLLLLRLDMFFSDLPQPLLHIIGHNVSSVKVIRQSSCWLLPV